MIFGVSSTADLWE